MSTPTLPRSHPAARFARNGHREAFRQLAALEPMTRDEAEISANERLNRVLTGPAPSQFKDAFAETFKAGLTNYGLVVAK